MARASKIQAILIPYPLQGHVIPAVHLATKLASNGFTITFVNTHYIHHQISSSTAASASTDIFEQARSSGLDIRYETIGDGFPLGFDRSLNHDQFFEGFLHVFPAHVEELLKKLAAEEGGERTKLMIADSFFVWPSTLASKYEMLYASFWTEPALVLSLYFHLDLLKLHGHFGSQKNREDSIDYIPGVNSINPKDVMSYLQPTCDDIDTICHRIIYRAFADAKRANFIIINTVHELEPEIITALNKARPTYPIGPLFPLSTSPVSTSLWPESDCSSWLAAQPDRSVLYISFGSYAHTSKEVIHAMALGLLRSSIRFIWAIRPDIVSSDDPNPLPKGFEELARGKGLVVTWCSQREVLMDPAVGGFLTHCGWNSILESVWCGVPLLCYPLYTDQFTNRKLVVDDWMVGINLSDQDCVTDHEVARNIDRLMMGESADELRVNVEKTRKIIKNALADNGSSQRCFHKFLEDVKVNVDKITG